MANHKQAKKRIRQTGKRTIRNRIIRSKMRTYVKRVRALVAEGKTDEAKGVLTLAVQQLDKAVNKGVVHRNTASRNISRLTTAVAKMS